MKKLVVVCLFSMLLFACNSSQKTVADESNVEREEPTDNKPEVPTTPPKDYPFFAYNFGGLENMTPAQQVKILKDHGYDGVTLQMAKAEHVDRLPQFLQLAENTPDFHIYSVFVRYNFADSEVDRNRWKGVVDLIKGKDIDLWFIFGKHEDGIDDAHVDGVMELVADYAQNAGVTVTLYPHSWCYFDTAESALPMLQRLQHPNLKLAIHTCHELKAGNHGRLDEVVHNVKDHLSFITVAGASKTLDASSRKAMDATTIQALEDGEYDYAKFLTALKEVKFKGPVGFINFKVTKDPNNYLPASLNEWNRLKSSYLE